MLLAPVVSLFALAILGLPVLIIHVVAARRDRNAAMLMAYMAAASSRGYPLGGAIAALAQSAKGRFARSLAEVAEVMAKGAPLSLALGFQRRLVPPDYVDVIHAGESSGRLPEACRVLSRRGLRSRARRWQLFALAAYPLALIWGITGVGALFLTIIQPKFFAILGEFQTEMPLLARFAPMLWSWSILAVLMVVTYLVLVAIPSPTGPRLLRTKGVIDTIKWYLPFARGYERYEAIRLFAQALQIGLSGGVPIREALKGACRVPVNGWAGRKLQRLYADVEMGVPLSSAADQTGLFPRRFVHLLAMSEAGGIGSAGLPGLDEIVVSCDDACDRMVHWVTSLVLPVVVLCLGVAVCALCLNVFLTLTSLTYHVLGVTLNP